MTVELQALGIVANICCEGLISRELSFVNFAFHLSSLQQKG